ncbi:MAG: bifunctional UDP-N-acetylmuramoyl-tripeptide:D-alanyl-D-alanine ligase/alanine racemase [Bacteroidetes bacterium]|nr:bifunctional UDP-N-acetylmuramoyl-tripeptide:D-alanyl-D-alanine ligase/alanine racemase [Bacteroidota bacterium]
MTASFPYSLPQVVKITHGEWKKGKEGFNDPLYLSLDSRKISFPKQTIFFAIDTHTRKASDLIPSLYNSGVRNFVTNNNQIKFSNFNDANFVVVKDVISALQKLAASHRKELASTKVIGITGSNGKTIVKEWLNFLLSSQVKIYRSPRSYNSQIGVPLSVINTPTGIDLAIFEAGISQPNEMQTLRKIIQPKIGILTNIGNAHDEGFQNRKEKIREKLILFNEAQTVIYGSDDDEVETEMRNLKRKRPQLQLFSWSSKKKATLQIIKIIGVNEKTIINGIFKGEHLAISIPFSDKASIENAITCWCAALLLFPLQEQIFSRFKDLTSIEMRLQLIPAINHCTIINDSYSNDLDSLNIALDFLNQQKQHALHTVILSDILEAGINENKLFKLVATLLKHKKIDRLIGLGPKMIKNKKAFHFLNETHFYKTTAELIDNFSNLHFQDEIILIKGARTFELEKLSSLLEKKVHQTVLETNLKAIAHNLKVYKSQIRPTTKIMVMVKAFAYGSGSNEVASVLQFHKADYLGVAYADEGVALRESGITLPIMVMNVDESVFNILIKYQLEPEIFSISLMEKYISFLHSAQLFEQPIHVKIDTGMHRLGLMPNEVKAFCKLIENQKSVKIKSVFSHLAASDDPSKKVFTLTQFALFKRLIQKIKKHISYSFDVHIANTAAISLYPQLQMDMVRLGIGLYGIDSDKKMLSHLENANTLRTHISQIKKIKTGESIGYGGDTITKKETTIAIVRIGYADGYSRRFSKGTGKMLVHNQLAPVIGKVCMDMTILDISKIKNVREGDEVIVFGEKLPIQKLAKWIKTIPYEIMTGISGRVKRVYFEEQ